jgi:hypothetical protein
MASTFSPVSWQRMSGAVEDVRRRLLRAVRALDDAGIAHAVVGGNAVAAWVSRVDREAVRNTRDVDLLLRRSDLPAAIAALEAAGFRHRRIASLGRAGHLEAFIDPATNSVRDGLHVVFAGEKVFRDDPAASASVEESEDAGEFRLIALPALVRMKLSAWRDKDRVHLRDLVSVGLVDATWLPRFDEPLRGRLHHILETPDE